jgi:tRNA-splicing ligase RtcB
LAAGALPKFAEKITQLGSYGGGNHFGECEAVEVAAGLATEVARLRAKFVIKDASKADD